ncbi:MAG TPA: hypothetical protein VKQ29_09730 [Aliidongia sp.]|nr:hypothetical protein [Aliidongia sp.]
MSDLFIPLVGRDRDESPFHDGELAIQRRLGLADKMDRAGRRGIRPFMPERPTRRPATHWPRPWRRVPRSIRRAGALPFRWSAPDFSPALERTGSWTP